MSISDRYRIGSVPDDVIEVNTQGHIVVSYKNKLKSTARPRFQQPRYLAVNKSEKFIFVADLYNYRIVMLNLSLN